MAVTTISDLTTQTLSIVQTADDGAITIQKSDLTGDYTISDGAGTVSASSMTNLRIDASAAPGDVTFINNSFVSGNVAVELGDGIGLIRFEGKGSIGGNLTVTGGTEKQEVQMVPSQRISIGGDLVVNLSGGGDEVSVDTVDIGGDILLTQTSWATFDGVNLAGDASLVSSGLLAEMFSSFENSTIDGSVSYTGGDGYDAFGLLNTTVAGNVQVQLNDNYTQVPFWGFGSYVLIDASQIGGIFDIQSGANISVDQIELTGNEFQASVNIDLGMGDNLLDVTGGTILDTQFSYRGQDGVDTVQFSPDTTSPLAASFELGDGADSMTLAGGAFSSLWVDFADTTPDVNDQFFNEWSTTALAPVTIDDYWGFRWEFDGANATITQTMNIDGTLRIKDVPRTIGSSSQLVVQSSLNNQSMEPLFHVSDDLMISMMNGANTDLDMRYGATLNGNLAIDLGDGARMLLISQELPPIVSGNMTIVAGTGNQTISGFAAQVGGDLMIDMGTGDDVMNDAFYRDPARIDGRATLMGVNNFDTTGAKLSNGFRWTIGGDMYIDVRSDDVAGDFTLDKVSIDGNFGYFGSAGVDSIVMDGSAITGNLYVNLMGAESPTDFQTFAWNNNSVVGGDVTVLAHAVVNSNESVRLGGSGENAIGGSVFVDLAGGQNAFDFVAPLGGARLVYRGAAAGANNQVAIDTNSPGTRTNIVLGNGDDQVEMAQGSRFNDLRIDFGGGDDQLINGLAQSGQKLTFNSRWLNLDGFSVFANVAIDNTNLVQVEAVGMMLEYGTGFLSATGTDDIWRVFTPTETSFDFAEFNPTANVSMQLMDNSGTDVGMVFSSPVEGGFRANLGDGDRDLQLINLIADGSTPVGKIVRVVAGEGDQQVNLAVDSPGIGPSAAFGSTFQTVINLGDGNDELRHDLDLNIGGAFIVQGVNQYVNDRQVDVGYNMLFSNQDEFQATNFENNGTIAVANHLTWLGGNAVDQLSLNDNVSVAGNAFIDLAGGGTGNGAVQLLQIRDSYFGRLTARAGDATNGNQMTTSQETRIGQDLFVDFSKASDNQLTLLGDVAAGAINIRGGEGRDDVRFGINADLLDAVINTFGDRDTVTLDTNADVNRLTINFGAAVDQYFNDFGGFEPFDVDLINL